MSTTTTDNSLKPVVVPCGELACQHDATLSTFTTTVVSCTPRPAQPKQNNKNNNNSNNSKKKKTKNKSQSKSNSHPSNEASTIMQTTPQELYDVILQDTILFPTGGGQPCDYGLIDSFPCRDVRNEGGTAIHTLSTPLEPHTTVHLQLNVARREDHAAHHTAQHLLSGVVRKNLQGVDTLGWSLSSGTQPCFVDLNMDPSQLTDEVKLELEKEANKYIRAGTPVTAHWLTPEQFQTQTQNNHDGALRTSANPLPEEVSPTVDQDQNCKIRVISIGQQSSNDSTHPLLDMNPCCGTHNPTLTSLGAIKLLHVERLKRKNQPPTSRLYYLTHNRLLQHFHQAITRQSALSTLLSVGVEEVVERVERLLEQKNGLEKRGEGLLEEVVELHLDRVFGEKKRVVVLQREGGGAAEGNAFLKLLQVKFEQRRQEGGMPQVLLVAHGETSSTTTTASNSNTDQGGMFLLCGDPDLVSAYGPKVASLLQGRGGGRKGTFQGKCSSLEKLPLVEEMLQKELGLDEKKKEEEEEEEEE